MFDEHKVVDTKFCSKFIHSARKPYISTSIYIIFPSLCTHSKLSKTCASSKQAFSHYSAPNFVLLHVVFLITQVYIAVSLVSSLLHFLQEKMYNLHACCSYITAHWIVEQLKRCNVTTATLYIQQFIEYAWYYSIMWYAPEINKRIKSLYNAFVAYHV